MILSSVQSSSPCPALPEKRAHSKPYDAHGRGCGGYVKCGGYGAVKDAESLGSWKTG